MSGAWVTMCSQSDEQHACIPASSAAMNSAAAVLLQVTAAADIIAAPLAAFIAQQTDDGGVAFSHTDNEARQLCSNMSDMQDSCFRLLVNELIDNPKTKPIQQPVSAGTVGWSTFVCMRMLARLQAACKCEYMWLESPCLQQCAQRPCTLTLPHAAFKRPYVWPDARMWKLSVCLSVSNYCGFDTRGLKFCKTSKAALLDAAMCLAVPHALSSHDNQITT